MQCMEIVRIHNYDSMRAEKGRIESDNKLRRMKKHERTGRLIQLGIVVFMFICILAMAACTIGALFINDGSSFEIIISVSMATTTCFCCLFAVCLMKRTYRKLHEIDEYDVTFDNVETRYHRLVQEYAFLEPRLERDAIVIMCYNKDNQLVCSHEFRPRTIQKAEKNRFPVYDVFNDCLWVPECVFA